MVVSDAAVAELDAVTLYKILALRSAVFVLEQNCPYLDADGRDLEPGARMVWTAEDGAVSATLRVLRDGPAFRIGRVATAPGSRGRGLAAALMIRALELAGDSPVVLDAQSQLADWYAGFGFRPDGPEFVEDGIPHLPMRREAR